MSYDEGDIIKVSEDGRFRLRIVSQDYADNPRENGDYETHIASVPHPNYLTAEKDNGPYGHIMQRLSNQYGRSWDVAELFARAVRMLGGVAYPFDSHPREGVYHVVYLTKEDVVRLNSYQFPDGSGWTFDPDKWLKSEADEYTAYAEGEVYGFIVEEAVAWEPVEPALVADAVSMATWEHAESSYGFYGRESGIEEEGMATFNLIVANAAEK